MNRIDKYSYWTMLSDYDLETVEVLITGKRWIYVAYLCQQAMERQLKGMYVYYMNAEAPKTHNVSFLYSKTVNSREFSEQADCGRFDERRYECEDFLVDLMYYYMSDYPFSYKNIMSRFVDEKTALQLYADAKDYIRWLRTFQPEPVEVEVPKD